MDKSGVIRIGMVLGHRDDIIKNAVLSILNYAGIDINYINIQMIMDKTKYVDKYDILLLERGLTDTSKAISAIECGGVLILNADEKNFQGLKFIKPVNVLSYGFNPKSTVTVSSVTQREYLSVQCCVQRGFSSLKGDFIEQGEFCININDIKATALNVLASVIVSVLCGAKVSQMESLFLISEISLAGRG